MEFDHNVSVAEPLDAVWAAMTDIERVAPCVPNTRVTGRAGEDSYDVEITAAVGPFEITSKGNITLSERDDAAHREVLQVVAKDADGEKLADATLTVVLTATDSGTEAAVHTSVEIGGLAALVSEEMLDGVAQNALGAFATNLEAMLCEAPGAA